MTEHLRLRTAAWYGDRELMLRVPSRWQVEMLWPRTPPPLRPEQIVEALERPIGQPPIRELARSKRRPVIVCDDLTRPTPANLVIPHLLQQLEDAGIAREDVTIVVGGGTHRPPGREQVLRKVGLEAAGSRLLAHDCNNDVLRVGRTSFGTPVLLNRLVATADLVVGVGGVYPQHSVGFGGGSKLALGVLGKRSIIALHYGHPSVAGTYDVDNDFRRDLDEIAEMAGLRTIVTLHVNADREVVRAVSGDHRAYYQDAVAFSREAYAARVPGDADVVIVNGYPMDVSLTFTRSKGMAPLYQTGPGASRVLVAACPEGLGYHALFPFLNGSRFERQLHQLRRLSVVRPSALPGKVGRLAGRLVARVAARRAPIRSAVEQTARLAPVRLPIHLYRPDSGPSDLPEYIPGLQLQTSWADTLAGVEGEQKGKQRVNVVVYPCAALQCLQWQGGESTGYLTESVAG